MQGVEEAVNRYYRVRFGPRASDYQMACLRFVGASKLAIAIKSALGTL